MFEGTLDESRFQEAMENGRQRSADLHRMEWPVLVARLAAARDLRRVVSRSAGEAGGNFACFTSGETGEHPVFLNESDRSVNPDTLGHGKDTGAMVPSAADGAVSGDREF